MKELLRADKIKITPILNQEEKDEFMKTKGYEVIGLFLTENENGPVINIGYPSIASYNQVLGNMFAFDKNHGMYFVTGKFPETQERPIYIVTISDSLTIDSYTQTNATIVGDYDLVDVLQGEKKEEQIKRA